MSLLVLVAAMVLGMSGMHRALPPLVRGISAAVWVVDAAALAVLVLEAAARAGSR